MKLSIIIPTYSNQELLEKCLDKLQAGLESLSERSEIIIVNNSPKKDQIANIKFKNSNSKLKTILNNKNLGFARACNQGAEKAQGEYLLFLNDDCYVEKNTVLEMIKFLDKNKDMVATQPAIINGIAASPGAPRNDKEVGYIVDLKKARAKTVFTEYELQNWKINKLTDSKIFVQGWVYGLSGTCLLIRKNIFMRIGKFDESFHSYLEDVDLFIRLAKKNYHYYPTLSAVCRHEHMATSQKMGSYKQQQDFKNWIRIILKNYPLNFILKNFFSLFIERLRNLNGIMKRQFKLFKSLR